MSPCRSKTQPLAQPREDDDHRQNPKKLQRYLTMTAGKAPPFDPSAPRTLSGLPTEKESLERASKRPLAIHFTREEERERAQTQAEDALKWALRDKTKRSRSAECDGNAPAPPQGHHFWGTGQGPPASSRARTATMGADWQLPVRDERGKACSVPGHHFWGTAEGPPPSSRARMMTEGANWQPPAVAVGTMPHLGRGARKNATASVWKRSERRSVSADAPERGAGDNEVVPEAPVTEEAAAAGIGEISAKEWAELEALGASPEDIRRRQEELRAAAARRRQLKKRLDVWGRDPDLRGAYHLHGCSCCSKASKPLSRKEVQHRDGKLENKVMEDVAKEQKAGERPSEEQKPADEPVEDAQEEY